MESGLDAFRAAEEQLVSENKLAERSISSLAWLGDGIYELYFRQMIFARGDQGSGAMHRRSKQIVSAAAQAKLARVWLPLLREEERALFRRARNYRSKSTAKHAQITEYRQATAVEALCAYLYLKGETGRLLELLEIGRQFWENEEMREVRKDGDERRL